MSATDMDMKAVRKQLGLTQVELGKLVYLTDRQVRNIESSKAKIPPLVEEKLAAMIGKKDATGENKVIDTRAIPRIIHPIAGLGNQR